MNTGKPVEFLLISELARNAASTPRLIRHFERQGLIVPVQRGQYQVYPRNEERKLKIVMILRDLGFSTKQMRSLLKTYTLDELSDLTWTPGIANVLAKHLAQLQERQTRLQQQMTKVKAILDKAQLAVVLYVMCVGLTQAQLPFAL